MAIHSSLLISPHHWAQDEGVVTDTFADMVSQLLQNDSAVVIDSRAAYLPASMFAAFGANG